jgi:hypothetical protein
MGIIRLSLQFSHPVPMPDQEPQLDLTKIAFPTDRLSIKDLRRLLPDGFDRLGFGGEPERVHYFQMGSKYGGEELRWMLNAERAVASWAFNAALGRASSEVMTSHPMEVREMLAESFIEYRLASGPHQAEQMIRDIEVQASAQAKAFGLPQSTQVKSR